MRVREVWFIPTKDSVNTILLAVALKYKMGSKPAGVPHVRIPPWPTLWLGYDSTKGNQLMWRGNVEANDADITYGDVGYSGHKVRFVGDTKRIEWEIPPLAFYTNPVRPVPVDLFAATEVVLPEEVDVELASAVTAPFALQGKSVESLYIDSVWARTTYGTDNVTLQVYLRQYGPNTRIVETLESGFGENPRVGYGQEWTKVLDVGRAARYGELWIYDVDNPTEVEIRGKRMSLRLPLFQPKRGWQSTPFKVDFVLPIGE